MAIAAFSCESVMVPARQVCFPSFFSFFLLSGGAVGWRFRFAHLQAGPPVFTGSCHRLIKPVFKEPIEPPQSARLLPPQW